MTRSERRNINDDVESQILEMLTARGGGDDPSAAGLEAVLAELDPPEFYGSQTGQERDQPTRHLDAYLARRDHRHRVASFVFV